MLAVPASAGAQAIVDAGPGGNPHVAVDPSGAAHITSAQNVSGQDVANYCKLAIGATACANPHAFEYPNGPNQGGDSGVWPLLPPDGRVLVLDARCCAAYADKFVYTSTDGGQSFGAGANVGTDGNSGANILGAALYAPAGALGRPDESLLTISSLATLGLSFQATGTVDQPASTSGSNVLTQGNDASGTLALTGDTLVAAWTNITDQTVYWRRWSGTGDVNDSANWTPIAPVGPSNASGGSRLAYGPSGIYLAYSAGEPGVEQIVMRKFNGSGWGEAIPISDTGTTGFFDLVEDTGGVLHFVWQDANRALSYRVSTDLANGVFSPARTLVENNPNGGFFNLRLATELSGNWVTWEDSSPARVRALYYKPGVLAAPTRGVTVNAVPVKGKVRVKLPAGLAARAGGRGTSAGASGFVPLESLGRQVPVGSTLDTTKGTVRLTLATNTSGGTQIGNLSGGMFRVGQSRKNPLTELRMTGGGLTKCGKAPRGGAPKLASDARKRRRSLFANVRGRFRTRGRHSTATVRGTKYTVTDTCAGTLTKVKSGRVVVRDLVRRRTKTLKAGQRYFASRTPVAQRRGHG
jgi:hypothetical protein